MRTREGGRDGRTDGRKERGTCVVATEDVEPAVGRRRHGRVRAGNRTAAGGNDGERAAGRRLAVELRQTGSIACTSRAESAHYTCASLIRYSKRDSREDIANGGKRSFDLRRSQCPLAITRKHGRACHGARAHRLLPPKSQRVPSAVAAMEMPAPQLAGPAAGVHALVVMLNWTRSDKPAPAAQVINLAPYLRPSFTKTLDLWLTCS